MVLLALALTLLALALTLLVLALVLLWLAANSRGRMWAQNWSKP